MAVYINIKKTLEENTFVEYVLSSTEREVGKVRIDKNSGDIFPVKEVSEKDLKMYSRAMHKLRKHWESGELPDVTCWAS